MRPVVDAGVEFLGLDPSLNGLGEAVNLRVGNVEPAEVAVVEPRRLERCGDGRGILAPENEVGQAVERLPHPELPECFEVRTHQLAVFDHDALHRQRLGRDALRVNDDINAPPASGELALRHRSGFDP